MKERSRPVVLNGEKGYFLTEWDSKELVKDIQNILDTTERAKNNSIGEGFKQVMRMWIFELSMSYNFNADAKEYTLD